MNELIDAFAENVRGHARLNSTVAALLRRGLDTRLAHRLQGAGYNLAKLKGMDEGALLGLGLSETQARAIHAGGRAPLPFANLAQVLWANRYTCCVCRDPSLSVIFHHIEPWAQSHDHSVPNLAVLCLEHHARAHRKGELEQNLTGRQLKEFKRKWEEEVALLDPQAILEASRVDGYHWWWFNHLRLFEMADRLGVNLTKLPRFFQALARGRVDQSGALTAFAEADSYMYQGGDGIILYAYVLHVLESVLSQTAIFNISDDLDPGFLSEVVRPGDILLVQGKHYFKVLNPRAKGPGQASEVRREANHVRVSFTIDRWEAVANSSWAGWLAGTKSAASIVRVQSIERHGPKLHLACTGLAIGSALRGLSTRSYVYPTWKLANREQEDWEDDWLDGFGDDPDVAAKE